MGCGSSQSIQTSDMSGEPDPFFDLIIDESLQRNEWPEEKEKKYRQDEKQSLMLKTMNKEMFERFKNHKTAVAGWTIARAINTGIMYPGSFVGCHAGDLESYTDYKELFNPVIEAYHKGFKMDGSCRHVTDLDSSKMQNTLSGSAKGRIISTRIRVARNLSMFPLNPGGTKETRLEIADLMGKVFGTLDGDLAGQFFRHSNMTPEQEKQLVDDHFLFKGRDKMQAASGYHQHWPHGRGIFLNAEKTFLLWINEGDHCRIISMEQGGDVKRVFDRLAAGIAAIEAGVKKVTGKEKAFMTHDIIGCITCCPSNIGTGMRGSVHIKVPLLIAKHGLEGLDAMCREKNCQARGTMGEHTQVIDRIDVSNWRRLGFPEYQLVDNMIETVNLLAQMEDELEAQA
ncbi:arginine kinase-like [Sycon ciliatum]|uniref:arginine kinase-like n=1 Tax=Sycon ciliatum TaxID=27933 RepID=UPI0020AAC49C|eukprot:scpid55869/ scgid29542/ Arginine kinase